MGPGRADGLEPHGSPEIMKIATWNVNSLNVRLPQVLAWLAAQPADAPVDVLALQELKLTDDKFPAAAFTAAGYHAQWFGQKTYNGVALLSRSPASDVVKNIPGFEDDMARVITATCGRACCVIGAYFPNGQAPDSGQVRLQDALAHGPARLWCAPSWSRTRNWCCWATTTSPSTIWTCGDPVGLAGTIHCTDEERTHLRALIDLGLHDSFRLFEQPPRSYSWWDYRMLGFQKNRGMRIDHILVSEALRPRVTACMVDRTPRKNPQPSDHAPVVVTLDVPVL
jgi:exodeoxyribonuclease-3